MSSNILLEHKVDRLEEALIRLADIQAETHFEIQSLKKEMSEFKEEMRYDLEQYKEENRIALEQYKEENRLALEQYKEENREEHKKLNQEFGRLSNKMGTIVEDIIYPAARPLISRYFNVEINNIDIYSNVSKKNEDGEREEFDIIAVTSDKVFLIEVKSTMRDSYINDFKEKTERFFKFFPEYQNRKLIPIMASLSIQPNTVHMLTLNNMYAMAYREWEYMDLLNFK
ncbi:MAG: NERD domain-containing protein [bacterium]